MRKPMRLTNAGMALAVLFFLTLGGAPLVQAKMWVETGTGWDISSRAKACSRAKSDAKSSADESTNHRIRVVWYGVCDCSKDNNNGEWACTVEVRVREDD